MEDTSSRRKLYTIRASYLYQSKHFNDAFLNLGYDYSGNILRKSLSPELFANPMQHSMISLLEGMLNFLIQNVKFIKKTFSIAHDKNTLNIN